MLSVYRGWRTAQSTISGAVCHMFAQRVRAVPSVAPAQEVTRGGNV